MNVETHPLSSYDLNSNPPFSFSNSPSSTNIDHPELRSQVLRTSDSTGSFSSGSPVDTRERVDIVDCMDWGWISNGVPPTPPTKRREREESTVSGEESVNGKKVEKCPLNAAMKVQKVYRSYRTRRMLADSAVVAEELWWQVIDYARLNYSTVSFFNFLKPETAARRWNRVILNASKVGKGLSKDAKAQKLAFQHWIEAIDPRHRYGHGLHLYYEEWCKADSGQPFFYWLDLGDGKDVDLPEFPRSKLRKQCIKYLGPQEREHYEYIIVEGKILHKQSGQLLDTSKGSPGAKWIFVMSTSKRLYAGEKKKGIFHHSSFLSGGATIAAGRMVAEDGVLRSVSPYSGHYRPTEDSLESFLQFLKDNGVNVDTVEIKKATEESESYEDPRPTKADNSSLDVSTVSESSGMNLPIEENKDMNQEATELREADAKPEYQRTLSGGLRSPKADVPKTAILQRINSKKTVKSYQLGHQLSRRWSTGAGPRIGCVADYPMELRMQALELTNLSPKPGFVAPVDGQVSPLLCLCDMIL